MTTTTELVPGHLDVTKLAVAPFLAPYREPTLTAYTQDLKAFLGWCQRYDVQLLLATRGQLEAVPDLRHLEGRGYAAATIARRFGTVPTFYKYTVIDGVLPANPADAVTRHPLEFAAVLAAARSVGPSEHVLVCLLGTLELRVSEVCGADITDLRYESGYELLHVTRKGAKPADVPLPIPVLRAVRDAVDGRATGPTLRTRTGRRMHRAGAARALARVGPHRRGSLARSAHGLRRTFCTTGLVAGISVRDMQHAMRQSTRALLWVTTWARPTSTATPPTPSPTTSPA